MAPDMNKAAKVLRTFLMALLAFVLLGPRSASQLSFMASADLIARGTASQKGMLCRKAAVSGSQRQLPSGRAATRTLLDPRSWMAPPASLSERLSPREWLRMYRTLGLPQDATRADVAKATSRLRRKYANDADALERVEAANLWIMTKILADQEDATRARQQANRLREMGDTPRKLFQKYIAGYLPPSIRQMFQPPTMKHFRWASAVIGVFALAGLCIPAQGTNFVGLAGASAMGFVYQRGRPEPVKDDMGNVGRVQKNNPKEMAACIVLVLLGAGLGLLLSYALAAVLNTEWQMCFCPTACAALWLISLFFRVHECFD
eukprot:TRINITY_DN26253_c0_g1_i1.p1 TRINITY_DN26253_c0_g1~~TRINITY_DN26253_c0_g1_i1.p1  ORF type:complete len:333 (-),score=56.56 TRINITY_DN26253_c0_g1_i1:75-1031(-)